MGQEHSIAGKDGSLAAALARGIGPRVPRSTASQVIVVNPGQDDKDDLQQDETFQKLKNIPVFYPILRNSLNIPGVKDEADVSSKFDHRSVFTFFHKFQEYLAQSTENLCAEQTNLGAKVRETDYAISSVLNCLIERQKYLARLQADLNKTQEINNQLVKITATLQEIVPMAQAINELLPPAERLPPLDLVVVSCNAINEASGGTSSGANNQPIIGLEQKVVDHQ